MYVWGVDHSRGKLARGREGKGNESETKTRRTSDHNAADSKVGQPRDLHSFLSDVEVAVGSVTSISREKELVTFYSNIETRECEKKRTVSKRNLRPVAKPGQKTRRSAEQTDNSFCNAMVPLPPKSAPGLISDGRVLCRANPPLPCRWWSKVLLNLILFSMF